MSCLAYNSISEYYAICEYTFNYVPVNIFENLIVLMLIKFDNILIVWSSNSIIYWFLRVQFEILLH